MLFASTDLAARIEAAECQLLRDCAAAVARRVADGSVLVEELAGGVAVYTGPDEPLNKLAGLGFAGAVDEDALARLERSFAERGTPLQAEVATLASPEVCALLSRRGYELTGFENVLGRALPADLSTSAADVAISELEPHELEAYIDVIVTGFATPDEQGVASQEEFARDALERVIRNISDATGYLRYLARRAGVVAGGASMRVFGEIGQLCGAATHPAHRRRGVQTALLAQRLADAATAGCEVATMTTQPGSKSQQNAQSQGFELLYSRAVLVLRPDE